MQSRWGQWGHGAHRAQAAGGQCSAASTVGERHLQAKHPRAMLASTAVLPACPAGRPCAPAEAELAFITAEAPLREVLSW